MAQMDQAKSGDGAKDVRYGDILDRVVSTAASVFQVPIAAVPLNSSMEQIDSWDSVSHLNFLLALEQEFQCSFSEEEFERFTSVSAVVDVISAKQPKAK